MTLLTKLLTPDARPARPNKAGLKPFAAITEAFSSLRRYQDIPQHFHKQWITAFLAGMVLVSIIAGLYLSVASRTAITGREIQHLQRLITENQRINADLQTQIAILLAGNSLEARATAAGYVPLQVADLEYLMVPGYSPQQGISLVSPPVQSEDIRNSPEYSESLFGWLARQLEAASLPLAQDH